MDDIKKMIQYIWSLVSKAFEIKHYVEFDRHSSQHIVGV